jgi:hypothetical protein
LAGCRALLQGQANRRVGWFNLNQIKYKFWCAFGK